MSNIFLYINTIKANLKNDSRAINIYLRYLNQLLRRERKKSMYKLVDTVELNLDRWCHIQARLFVLSQRKRILTEYNRFDKMFNQINGIIQHRKFVRQLNIENDTNYEY